jgi:gliding motility-associated-like protein
MLNLILKKCLNEIRNSFLIFSFICFFAEVSAQDFSNRGTDFWTGYGPHEKISSGTSDMTLYFTSDNPSTVTIYVGGTLIQTLNIPANSITASMNIPEAGATDARLQNEGVYINKGIYIHSTSPIVAYAQIWGSKVTATSILFPLKTLGRKYTSLNYTQVSNATGMRSYVFAIATENGTTIEVKPSAATSTALPVGTWTSRTLNRGDVWLIRGAADNTDLTGTQFRSVSSATGTCKPIAVFSGSQKISVTCSSSSSSSDNLFQQCFPVAAWGRKFVSAPTAGLNYSNNIYRIMINPDSTSTVVKVNGVTLPASVPGLSPVTTPLTIGAPISITNALYYDFVSSTPVNIETSSPVMVAQYLTNKDKCGNSFGSGSDPDMVYISPVEQTVDSIIVSPVPTENNDALNYINVNIKTADVLGFTIRNQANAVVPATFVTNPADPLYSYAQIPLTTGYSTGVFYKLKTTSGGFNAIAYGYATSESYAYNAGTNVKNLNHYLNSANPLSSNPVTKICKGTPTRLSVTLPYIPSSFTFEFFTNTHISPNTAVTVNAPAPNSSYTTNGTALYVFNLPGLYTFDTTGIFPVRVSSNNPSPDGCNGLEEVNYDLEVVGGPTASFTTSFSGCASNSVTFTNNSTDTSSTISAYDWQFGDGVGVSTLSDPNYTYTGVGPYNVRFRVINNEGCYDDTVKVLSFQNVPISNFGYAGISCVGNTISFSDSSSISNGTIVKWTWDFDDGSPLLISITSVNPTHVFTAARTYRVKLTVENASGCSVTHYEDVVIGNVPFASFDLPGNICLPNAATFNNTSTVVGGGTLSYTWDFGDASATSTVVSPNHVYSATGNYSVHLTASLGTCSKDTVRVFNTLYNNPTIKFGVNAENCLNSLTVVTDSSTAQNSVINNWSWLMDGTVTANTQNTSYIFSTTGPHNIKLIVTTDKGCIDSLEKTVIINLLPDAVFSVVNPACETKTVTFTEASIPNAGNIVEWDWDFGDGNHQVFTSGGNVTHIYATASVYSVKLTVKTDKGCYSITAPQNITINANPAADFDYSPLSLCAPANVNLNNNTTISDGTLAQVTYSWDLGNGITSILSTPVANYAIGGQFPVLLVATSNVGCVDSIQKTIDVFSLPNAGYSLLNTGNVCSNQSLNIQSSSTLTGFGNIDKVEIYWDYLNNITDVTVDNSPLPNEVYNYNYATFGSPLIKQYRVLMRVYNGNSCTKDYYLDIDVHAAPEIVFPAISPVCEEIPAYNLTMPINSNPALTGTGVFTGSGVSANGLFNPDLAGSGPHNILYTFTGSNGCVDTASQQIEVYPTPVLDYPSTFNILEGDAIPLSPNILPVNSANYNWTPADYLDNATSLAPICNPTDDVTYTVSATSNNGCKNQEIVIVKVVKDFIVPNTFTPNGDGINDYWVIENLSLYPNHQIQVFNRYGQVVFESKNYSEFWDGKYKGKSIPAGTYYYIIDLDGQRTTKKGYVTIIK